MIRFACECGQQLQAREENAGKDVLCPACKRRVTVPAAAPSEAVMPDEPPPAPPRPPDEERVRRERPALGGEYEGPRDEEDRPRRQALASSGKAISSLVLGILSLCGCTCLAGLPSIVLGILALRDIGGAAGALAGKPMAIIGIVLGGLGTLCWPPGYFLLLVPATSRVREAAERTQSSNNLKQMAIALHNYHDAHGALPPAAWTQPGPMFPQQQGKLSWRVAILPFIEEATLYRQFKFDEPWDGPNNIKLLGRMPKVFQSPGDGTLPPDHTRYQAFVGNGAAFEKNEPLRIPMSFTDGTSNTIWIAEAAQPVPWTKPDDIPFDPNRPIAPLLYKRSSGISLVAMVDGSVLPILPDKISQTTLKAAVTRSAGDLLGSDW